MAERLRQFGCDPIAGMAALATDATLPAALRGRLFAELATYVAPRRRATDLTGAGGGPLGVETWLNPEALTDNELRTLIDLLEKVEGTPP